MIAIDPEGFPLRADGYGPDESGSTHRLDQCTAYLPKRRVKAASPESPAEPAAEDRPWSHPEQYHERDQFQQSFPGMPPAGHSCKVVPYSRVPACPTQPEAD